MNNLSMMKSFQHFTDLKHFFIAFLYLKIKCEHNYHDIVVNTAIVIEHMIAVTQPDGSMFTFHTRDV